VLSIATVSQKSMKPVLVIQKSHLTLKTDALRGNRDGARRASVLSIFHMYLLSVAVYRLVTSCVAPIFTRKKGDYPIKRVKI